MSLNINKKGPNKGLLLYGYTKDRGKVEKKKRQKGGGEEKNTYKSSPCALLYSLS